MPNYRGRELETVIYQLEDGQWTCRYFIVDSTKLVTGEGHAPGFYATQEEAEVAGLKEGQRAIDSHNPLLHF